MLICFMLAISQSLPRPDFLQSGRKKRELDLLGLLIFAGMLSSLLLLLDLVGRGTAFNSPAIISLITIFAFTAICFVLVEVFWAKQPVLSPSLLKQRGVASQYTLQVLLLCAQFSVCASSFSFRGLVIDTFPDCFKYCNVLYADRESVELCSCAPYFAYIFW